MITATGILGGFAEIVKGPNHSAWLGCAPQLLPVGSALSLLSALFSFFLFLSSPSLFSSLLPSLSHCLYYLREVEEDLEGGERERETHRQTETSSGWLTLQEPARTKAGLN